MMRLSWLLFGEVDRGGVWRAVSLFLTTPVCNYYKSTSLMSHSEPEGAVPSNNFRLIYFGPEASLAMSEG